jgi:antitoxin HigA-1
MTCVSHQETVWSACGEIVWGSGQSGLMINGEFALYGMMVMRKMLKLSTTTKVRKSDLLPIPTPGEILLEEFLKPAGLSQNALARAIGVSPRRINEIVLGKRAITADTDLRLARYYRISEGIFLGLQADYELRVQKRLLGDRLDFIKPRAA